MMFAKRTAWEFNQNKITKILESLHQSKVRVLNLTESNPTVCGFYYPQKKILQALSSPSNMIYSPTAQGLKHARDVICQYYQTLGKDVAPERIMLTSSTSEAYSFLFRLLSNPREGVLFPRPSYPLFQFLTDINDLSMESYPLIYEDRWKVSCEQLFEQLQSLINIKAIVCVNPNNPTGSFISENEIQKINIVSDKYNMAIISDEVFYDYSFEDTNSFPSFLNNSSNLTFVMGGLSKSLALPQMKVSWIIVNGPPKIVTQAIKRLEIIADTFLSVNIPAQNAFSEWFLCLPEIQQEIKKRIKRNYSFLRKTVSWPPGSACLHTQGGWYAVLKLPSICQEEQYCLDLLSQEHVYVHSGYFFDFSDEPYIVISLLCEQDIFEQGVTRIIKCITQQINKKGINAL